MSWWDDLYEGAKQWANDPLGETGKFIYNKALQKYPMVKQNHDYLYDPYAKTEQQFRNQQMVGSIPLIGQWFTNYMRSRNLSDWQAQMRRDYSIDWGDTKYPWLSDLWSANPNASALKGVSSFAMYGGAGAKISKNLKELYAPDKKLKKKERPAWASLL